MTSQRVANPNDAWASRKNGIRPAHTRVLIWPQGTLSL